MTTQQAADLLLAAAMRLIREQAEAIGRVA